MIATREEPESLSMLISAVSLTVALKRARNVPQNERRELLTQIRAAAAETPHRLQKLMAKYRASDLTELTDRDLRVVLLNLRNQ